MCDGFCQYRLDDDDSVSSSVSEVVQTLQLSSERDSRDIVGDLSVCLDGLQVDPEVLAAAERKQGKKK